MKVIMFITQCLSGGGAEKNVANISLELHDKVKLIIVTYSASTEEYKYAGTRINLNITGTGFFSRISASLKRIIAVKKLKKKFEVDTSVSFAPQCDYVNLFSRRKGERCILTALSNMSACYSTKISRLLKRLILRQADLVVAISKGGKLDLIKNFKIPPQDIVVIYDPLNIEDIQNSCLSPIDDKYCFKLPKKNYIVSMGSFRYPKGHWHLIKAFYTIKDMIPNIDLVILGDGIYRKQYEELICKLEIKNRVWLPGFINPPYGVIGRAKLYAFSSLYEGFGHSVIEAMACSVPVISTDCNCGPREALSPESDVDTRCDEVEWSEFGVLTPPFPMKDIDVSIEISEQEYEYGKTILTLLNDKRKSLEYITKGKKRSSDFSNNVIAMQWLEIF